MVEGSIPPYVMRNASIWVSKGLNLLDSVDKDLVLFWGHFALVKAYFMCIYTTYTIQRYIGWWVVLNKKAQLLDTHNTKHR